MKALFILAIAAMAFGGVSFTPAPKKVKDASVSSSSAMSEFGYFRAHRQGKNGVALAWGTTTTNGVAGFMIERSYDGEFFDVVDQMPCNGSLRNNWKDESVFPGYIHYRIVCVMDDGSMHSTGVETVRIVQHG